MVTLLCIYYQVICHSPYSALSVILGPAPFASSAVISPRVAWNCRILFSSFHFWLSQPCKSLKAWNLKSWPHYEPWNYFLFVWFCGPWDEWGSHPRRWDYSCTLSSNHTRETGQKQPAIERQLNIRSWSYVQSWSWSCLGYLGMAFPMLMSVSHD